MDLYSAWRATRQWVPFAARTVGFGTISLTLGPLTRDHGASLWAMRRWCQSSARGLNIAVHVSGLENVPSSGAFVYCANHQSLLDILVLGAVLPGDYKWAAKRELMKIRERFGFLFQMGALFDSLTVAENVAFPLVEHTNKSPEEIEQIVRHKLELVGLPEVGRKMPAFRLKSFGDLDRMCPFLASALATRASASRLAGTSSAPAS